MNNPDTQATMLEETGTVVALDGAYVLVDVQRRSACGHCNLGDNCGTSTLAGLFSQRRNRVRLKNHLHMKEGDRAVIGIHEGVLLSTAALAYMLPLLLMITLGASISLTGLGDGASFIAAVLGLFAGMHITNRIMGDRDYQAREIVLLRNADEKPLPYTPPHSV